MKTLIEDLKKVLTSDIEDKDKYCEKLINGFLRERENEQLPIHGISNLREPFIAFFDSVDEEDMEQQRNNKGWKVVDSYLKAIKQP